MHSRSSCTRREFGKAVAGAAAATAFARALGALGALGAGPWGPHWLRGADAGGGATSAAGAGETARPWPGYDRAIVLDFLASPGPFNTPVRIEQLTDAMVRNAAASGITAVNLTIGGANPEAVFRDMARWENDLRRHPDVLTSVRSVADLVRAKAERKFGLIYGFQDTVAIGDDLSRVALYHAFGVRIIQLTYNVHNLVGDGCLVPVDNGLTAFGRDLVAELNERRIIV